MWQNWSHDIMVFLLLIRVKQKALLFPAISYESSLSCFFVGSKVYKAFVLWRKLLKMVRFYICESEDIAHKG